MKLTFKQDSKYILEIAAFTRKVKDGIIMTDAEFDEGIALIDKYDPRRKMTTQELFDLEKFYLNYKQEA